MKVKAHKLEVVVLDFNTDSSIEEIKIELQNNRYLFVTALEGGKTVDIPEWDDDHLLNKKSTTKEQIEEFFNKS